MTDAPATASSRHPGATGQTADLSRYLRRLGRHSRLAPDEVDAIMSLQARTVLVDTHRDIVSPGQLVTEAC